MTSIREIEERLRALERQVEKDRNSIPLIKGTKVTVEFEGSRARMRDTETGRVLREISFQWSDTVSFTGLEIS